MLPLLDTCTRHGLQAIFVFCYIHSYAFMNLFCHCKNSEVALQNSFLPNVCRTASGAFTFPIVIILASVSGKQASMPWCAPSFPIAPNPQCSCVPHLAAHLLCLCSSALLYIYLQNLSQLPKRQYTSLTCGVCSPWLFPSKLTAVYRTGASAAINCYSSTEINWAMWFVHQLDIWLGFYERPFAWTANRALKIPRAKWAWGMKEAKKKKKDSVE